MENLFKNHPIYLGASICRSIYLNLRDSNQWLLTIPRVTVHYGLKLYEIDDFMKKNSFPWTRERVRERANERMSAAERASEASSAERANEWAVRANERVDEQMAQYLRPDYRLI